MSFPFFDDETPTPEPVRLRVVEPTHTPRYRLTTRGKVCLWALWIIFAYLIGPFTEFWWTKF